MMNKKAQIGTLVCGVVASVAMLATSAVAQPHFSQSVEQYEQPYGLAYGAESRGYVPDGRDFNGNRVIIDGIIQGSATSHISGVGVLGGGGVGAGSPLAIGNNLNVITQGSWNTVIIDSTQINNGDVVANSQ